MSARETIQAIVEPLWAKHEELAHERAEIRVQLDLVEDEIKKLERVLRAADPEKFVKETKANENGHGNLSGRTVAEATIDRVHKAMWADSHTEHTIGSLAKKLGVSTATVDNAMTELRARGIARATGRVPNPSGKGSVMAFKIGEQVPPPVEKPPEPPRNEQHYLRTKVSAKKVAILLEQARGLPQPFSRADLKELSSGLSRSAVDFGVRVMLLDGTIEIADPGVGSAPTTYRVTDGS